MGLDAGSVVVELTAKTDGFTAKVNGTAKDFDTNMSKIEKSASQAEAAIRTSNQGIGKSVEQAATAVEHGHGRMSASGMILQHVLRSTTDSFNAGLPITMIFGEQVSRLGEAAALSGSSLGRFGAILSGPWGLAISAAISVAGVFAGKLLETGDNIDILVEKLRNDAEHTQRLDEAKARFATTLDGVKAALYDQKRALDDAAESEKSATQRTYEDAIRRAQNALAIRQQTAALLAQRQAELPALEAAARGPGQAAEISALGLPTKQGEIAGLQRQVAEANAAVADARDALARAGANLIAEQESRTTTERLNKQFDDEVTAAKNAALANGTVTTSLRRQIDAINARRAAALKAEQERQQAQHREQADSRQTGRQINLDQARAIVESIGGRVTSGQRSYAEQATLYARYQAGTGSLAAPPGHSDHETGQAVDVAKTAGLTLGKLVEAFKAAGVAVRQALDEGNHYHIGFGARGPSGDALARKAEAERTKGIRDDRAFGDQVASLNEQILAARKQQVDDATAQADIERRLVDERAAAFAAQVKADQKLGKYSPAETATLLALNTLRANQQKAAIDATEQDRLARQKAQITVGGLELQRQTLASEGELAKSAAERRAIALRLVDLDFQIEQAKIDELRASKNPVDKAEAVARQNSLDGRRTMATAIAVRSTQGPAEAYLNDLNRTPSQIAEELQGDAVDALKKFNDELGRSVTDALHLHGIFGDIIGDLVNIAIRQELIKPLANALFGGQQGGGGGFLGSLIKGAGKLFGIGSAAPQLGYDTAGLLALAGGGTFGVGDNGGVDRNLLSINGKPRARVSGSETIAVIPQGKAIGAVPGRAASPSGVMVISAPQFDLSNAVMTPQLLQQMDRISRQNAASAAAAMGQAVIKNVPQRFQQYQTDGT